MALGWMQHIIVFSKPNSRIIFVRLIRCFPLLSKAAERPSTNTKNILDGRPENDEK